MTMLSFRVEPAEAARVREMADALGIRQSEMIREALRRHLNTLAAQRDATARLSKRPRAASNRPASMPGIGSAGNLAHYR